MRIVLTLWCRVFENYEGEYIFKERHHPLFYHQVMESKIKMVNEADDGRDFNKVRFSLIGKQKPQGVLL